MTGSVNPYAAIHACRAAGTIASWRWYPAAPDRVTVVALTADDTRIVGEGTTMEAALTDVRLQVATMTTREAGR